MPIDDGQDEADGRRDRRSRRPRRTRTRTAREGHRPLERHGDLRRQGHRVPVLEVRPARPRLPLPRRSRTRPDGGRSGRRRQRPAATRDASAVRRARRTSTTSSTSRQSYLQKLLKQALATLGHHGEARAVASTSRTRWWRCRTPRRASSATTPSDEDAKKPFVEVSGRKGLGVKADDLLDTLIEQGRASEVAQAQSRARRRRARSASAETIAHRRGALLPDQVLARQGHRLRHRRGAELRGRERAVPPVRRRPRQQHLREAAGARRRSTRTALAGDAGDAAAGELDRRRRRPRAVGAGARGARLDEVVEQVGADARVLGAGQVRVRRWRRRSTPSTTARRS